MTEIYIVFHTVLEDSNIFYLTFEEAFQQIEILVKETGTKFEEWSIRKLKEGVKFEADLTEFFVSSNTLVYPIKYKK
jgi:hypothetical protein